MKKGMSTVVASVIMIALVVSLTGIVWTVVNTLVTENLETAESCFGVFDQVQINRDYTCYNSSGQETIISISIGDLDVDKILVAVESGGSSDSFEILNASSDIPNVVSYPSRNAEISIPRKNGGKTYIFSNSNAGLGPTNSIKIAPYVNGVSCEASDSLSYIDDCRNLISI